MKKLLSGIACLSMVFACGKQVTSNPPGSQDASLTEVAVPSTGGIPGTGGASGTGGTAGAGGTSDTRTAGGGGGTGTVLATGGAVAAGGRIATGGATSRGGSNGSGGGTRAGGTAGGGGATGRGGGTGNGGWTGTWTAGASETKPLGTFVDVGSMAAAQAAIDAYSGSGGLCLRYTGKFDFGAIPDPCTQHTLAAQILEIKKKNDITLLGADGSAANFGIHIASAVDNVIVRNMRFGLLPGGGDSDAINVEGMSGGIPTNIWIDHNELWSSLVDCPGAGDTSFDGLVDLKKGADNVTVSYNYLHDHGKASLNGFSDSDTEVRHITYHHNVFQTVGSRTPLQRGGYSHLLNNYLSQVTVSGANIRMNGYALIEGNYFENAKNPVTSRDSDAIGYWDLKNNNIGGPGDFTKFGITWSASDSTPTVDATDWTTTAKFPVSLGYSYTVDPPECLKAGLLSVVGAGKGLATLKCN
jgi:pectate lyase